MVIGFVNLEYFFGENGVHILDVSAELKEGILDAEIVVEFSTFNGSAQGKPRSTIALD